MAYRTPPRPNARWVPAHTDYSVALVGGTFAARHGGVCDPWGGAVYGRRSAAQRECDRLNRLGRRDGGRFEVRAHRRKAGWSYPLDDNQPGGMMLRFILRREVLDPHSGAQFETFRTLDAEVPELEAALSSGGYGNGGFDQTKLHGVEVLAPDRNQTEPPPSAVGGE